MRLFDKLLARERDLQLYTTSTMNKEWMTLKTWVVGFLLACFFGGFALKVASAQSLQGEDFRLFRCQDYYSIAMRYENDEWKLKDVGLDPFLIVFNSEFSAAALKFTDLQTSASSLDCTDFGERGDLSPVVCKSPLPYDGASLLFDRKTKRFNYNLPSVSGFVGGDANNSKDADIVRLGTCVIDKRKLQ
jgi:hypothetical protein